MEHPRDNIHRRTTKKDSPKMVLSYAKEAHPCNKEK